MNKEKIAELKDANTKSICILKEKLKVKKELLSKKRTALAKKQGIINELNKEKTEIKDLKKANKEVQKEIFRSSNVGKVANVAGKAAKITGKGALIAGKATAKFLNSEGTRKFIRNSTLGFARLTGLMTKTQVKSVKKKFK